uniref:Ig-like domain-containing protein n=1 Tax=Apteryx owenii TaxID=8824 RepID=A0A8B9S9U3_APTOW
MCDSKNGAVVLISSLQLLFPAALLDLSGLHQINGTWKESTTLPCTYVPSEGFTQQTLIWSMERDYSTTTIFRRDNSGDHVLLSRFRDRVTVPKNSPGDVTLQIKNLEIPDSGHYTCQVIWSSKNNSLITKEMTTTVKVVKGKSSNKALLLHSLSNSQSTYTQICLWICPDNQCLYGSCANGKSGGCCIGQKCLLPFQSILSVC